MVLYDEALLVFQEKLSVPGSTVITYLYRISKRSFTVFYELDQEPEIRIRMDRVAEPEPKLLAGAGILKFWLRLRLQGKLK